MSFRRIVLAWSILALAMIANGIFRETILVSVMDRTGAELVSLLLGVVIMLAVSRPFIVRWASPKNADLLRIGLVWLGMTLLFEFTFGHYVERRAWSEIAAEYRVWEGEAWPVALLTILIAPFLWARQHTAHQPAHHA